MILIDYKIYCKIRFKLNMVVLIMHVCLFLKVLKPNTRWNCCIVCYPFTCCPDPHLFQLVHVSELDNVVNKTSLYDSLTNRTDLVLELITDSMILTVFLTRFHISFTEAAGVWNLLFTH